MLFHTRAASTGAVTVRNAHPFKVVSSVKTIVGAHNGIISNHFALKSKYKRDAVEVDSEHIFLHLAENKDVGEIDGWGSIVWYEYPTGHPEEKTLYFSRFSHEALHIAVLATPDHETVYASTKDAIETACKLNGIEIESFWKTTINEKYTIINNKLMKVGDMPWEANPVEFEHKHGKGSNYSPISGGSYDDTTGFWVSHGNGRSYAGMNSYVGNSRTSRKGICASKSCNATVASAEFCCAKCLKELQDEYDTASA